MNKLNYTVQTKYPRRPEIDMAPVHVTDLAKDLTSWCAAKVSELMCLLGHENEPQEINIEWVAEANYQMLVLTYNVGTSAETQRIYQIDRVVSA